MSDFAMMDKKENRSASLVRRENRTGIPEQLKECMEQSTGLAFDDVRVNYNSTKPAKLDALAYTQGNQVEIGPGQERHLPHELGHVVQQKLGLVQANTAHSSGVPMNTDARLERQADEIAAGKSSGIIQRIRQSGSMDERSPHADNNRAGIVQRYICAGDYILSQKQPNGTTRMAMVKKNEPATIYFNEGAESEANKYLNPLGIVKLDGYKNYDLGNDTGSFARYGQGRIPDVRDLCGEGACENIRKNPEQPLRGKKDLEKAGGRLSFQFIEIKKFLDLARQLQKNMGEQIDGNISANIIRNTDVFLDQFRKDDESRIIYSGLGRDIFDDIYALRNVAQNRTNGGIALEILINDLEYRLNQIGKELEVVEYVPQFPTGCNVSADARSIKVPGQPKIKGDFNQESKLRRAVGWKFHYATPISMPSIMGEDTLYIEDAVGKSANADELANAHWVAHIYGRHEGQGDAPGAFNWQDNDNQEKYEEINCRFNGLTEDLRKDFFERNNISEGEIFKMVYVEKNILKGKLFMVADKNILKYKFEPCATGTFEPHMKHFLMELAKTIADHFVLQAITLDKKEEIKDIRTRIDETSEGRGFAYSAIEHII